MVKSVQSHSIPPQKVVVEWLNQLNPIQSLKNWCFFMYRVSTALSLWQPRMLWEPTRLLLASREPGREIPAVAMFSWENHDSMGISHENRHYIGIIYGRYLHLGS
jgi:hypothetical protein